MSQSISELFYVLRITFHVSRFIHKEDFKQSHAKVLWNHPTYYLSHTHGSGEQRADRLRRKVK